MIIYLSRNKFISYTTPTFATFIDSPSRHRETGHVIFIKLPDFLGRESVNRERSFSHIIFRVPVAFPHAKRIERIRRKPAVVKITAESARCRAARRLTRKKEREPIIVESISTRVINASKTHLVRDIRAHHVIRENSRPRSPAR